MCLETVCPGGQKGNIYPLGSVPPLGKDTQRFPSGSAHQSAEWLTGVHRQDSENLRQKAEAPGRGKARWPHRVKPRAPVRSRSPRRGRGQGGTGKSRDPSVRPRPPRGCPHPGICSIGSFLQGQLLRVKNMFLQPGELRAGASAWKWASLRTQRGFRARCFVQPRASLAPLLRASLSRGPGPEGRKRSPFCLELRPEPSPQSLAAPSTPPPAWPSAGLYFLPSQPHFTSQAALSVPPLSLCPVLSASALSLGRAPGTLLPTFRPQTLAPASRAPCGLALSKPVWGLAQISNHKYPLFLLTHTR